MAMVTVRYWAAAKQAAGLAEESLAASTLAEALATVLARHGEESALATVLARSSILVDGARASRSRPEGVAVGEGAIIEILPPFAGG